MKRILLLNLFILIAYFAYAQLDPAIPAPTCAVATSAFDSGTDTNPNNTNWESIVLSEVLADAGQSDSRNDAFVEIAGIVGTDIGGWVITNGEWAVILPEGTAIPGDGYYVIACSENTTENTFSTSSSGLTCTDCDFPGLPLDFDVCSASNSVYISTSISTYGFTFDNGYCGESADGDQVILFRPDGTPHDGIFWGATDEIGDNIANGMTQGGGSSGACSSPSDHISVQDGSYYLLGDNDENGTVNDVIQSRVGRKANGTNATGVKQMPIGDYDPDLNGLTNVDEGTCFAMPPFTDNVWVYVGTSPTSCNSSYMRITGSNGSHGVRAYAQNPSHMDDPDLDTDWADIALAAHVPASSSNASSAAQWGYSDHPNPGVVNDSDSWDFSINGTEVTAASADYDSGTRTYTINQCPAEPLTFGLDVYNYQHVEPLQETTSGTYSVTPSVKAGSFVIDETGTINDWTTTALGSSNAGTTSMTFNAGTLPTGNHTFTLVWDDFTGLGSGKISTVEGRAGTSNQHECYEDLIIIVNVIEPLALNCGGEDPCNIDCGAGDATAGSINLSNFITGGGNVQFELFDNGASQGTNTSGNFILPSSFTGPLTATATSLDNCGTAVSFTITNDCITTPPCPMITSSSVAGATCMGGTSPSCPNPVSNNFDACSSQTSYGNHLCDGFVTNNAIISSATSTAGGVPPLTSQAIRLRNNSNSTLSYEGSDGNGKDCGLGTISFDYRHWDGDGSIVTLTIEYSIDGGTNWNSIGTVDVTSTTYATFTSAALNIDSDDILVRISTDGDERVHIDNFVMTDYTVAGPQICMACPGETLTFSAEGTDLPDGGTLDWYLGTSADFTTTSGTLIGSGMITNSSPVYPSGLVINEVLADPTTGDSGGGGEWMELYNGTGGAIDISCYVFADDDGILAQVPNGTTIPAGGYYVALATAAVNNGNGEVALFDATGAFVYGVAWGSGNFDATMTFTAAAAGGCPAITVTVPNTLASYDQVVSPASGADESIGFTDPTTYEVITTPTQGTANYNNASTVITDVMYTIPECADITNNDFYFKALINPLDAAACSEIDATTSEFSVSVECPVADLIPLSVDQCVGDGTIDVQVNLTGLTSGTYLVTYIDETGATQTASIAAPATNPVTLLTVSDAAAVSGTISLVSVHLETGGDTTMSDEIGECLGTIDVDEAIIEIGAAPATTPTLTPTPITGCNPTSGGQVEIDFGVGANVPFEYEYTDPAGNSIIATTSINPVTISVSEPGSITLNSISTLGGCSTSSGSSASVTTTQTFPEATISQSDSCEPGEGEIDVNITTGTGPFTLDGTINDTGVSGGVSTYTGLSGGGTLTITSNDGCETEVTFSFDDNVCPVPVELVRFRAKKHSKTSSILEWTTTSETNNKGFEIQRSMNGHDFVTIDFVRGHGNSSSVVNYSYIDDKVMTGVNYYRLKQIDFDGRFDFSTIESVNFGNLLFNITPTITKDIIRITLDEKFNSSVKIEIFDVIGQRLMVSNISVKSTSKEINIADFATGYYLIKFSNEDISITQRIMKE